MKIAVAFTLLTVAFAVNAGTFHLGGISGPSIGAERPIPPRRVNAPPQQDVTAEDEYKEQVKEQPGDQPHYQPNVSLEQEYFCDLAIQALLEKLQPSCFAHLKQVIDHQLGSDQPTQLYPGDAPVGGQLDSLFGQQHPLRPPVLGSVVGPHKPLPFPPIVAPKPGFKPPTWEEVSRHDCWEP